MRVLEADQVKAEILVLETVGDVVLLFSAPQDVEKARCTARWNHHGSREVADVPKHIFNAARAQAIAAIANKRKPKPQLELPL